MKMLKNLVYTNFKLMITKSIYVYILIISMYNYPILKLNSLNSFNALLKHRFFV